MALSPCRDWLFVGLPKRGLRVWYVNGSRTNGSALFATDAEPHEPTGTNVADAQAQTISSIEITTAPMPGLSAGAAAPTDVIVIVAERDSGVVRHWMFSVERKMFGDNSEGTNTGEHRYPRLNLVGNFNTGGKEPLSKAASPSKIKHQDSLGPPPNTLLLCITIDMGSCFENLLLVVREDVIHVLKIQTVLYIMQKYSSIEEAYSVRAIIYQGEPTIISLSSTAASKIRIFPLEETSDQPPSTKQLFITPHASDTSSRVCSIETVMDESMQIPFVVLAWNSGVVDVYDLIHEKHIMKLEDSHITDQISTLSVVTFQRVVSKEGPKVEQHGYLLEGSYEDMYSSPTTNAGAIRSGEIVEKVRQMLIVVGTETGKLYGWKIGTLCIDDLSFTSMQKATIRSQAAHASHIAQTASIDGERALLVSVAADGFIKLWNVPALKLVGYVSSTVEGYSSTASCIEVMRDQSIIHDAGDRGCVKVYVVAGYEDGQIATWCVDTKRASFRRLETSTKHERRVSKICRVSNDALLTGHTEFLSCSLDMTIIQWQILESGNVQETRYFDIGTAIVDMILVKEQAIIALAHEVCKFAFAPSTTCNLKYLIKSEVDTAYDAANQLSEASTPLNSDEYINTPTTRSIQDPTEVAALSRPSSRSVDEYLTLHLPSAVLHLEAASISVAATSTVTDSAPATNLSEQDGSAFQSRNEMMTRHIQGSKSAVKLQRCLLDDDVLREYLQDYIYRHGSGGTVAANRLTHLIALRPELPNVKRPGFALAKSLKDLKLTAQSRVNSEEALQILRVLFTISESSCSSFDAPTMTRVLQQKEHSREKVYTQRIRERNQAKRKPIVSYNILGEKFVRWEDIPEERKIVSQNQSPPSPTNSLIVHTPPSPNMRDEGAFEKDSLSADIPLTGSPSLDVPSAVRRNSSNEILESPAIDSRDSISNIASLVDSNDPSGSSNDGEEEEEGAEEEEEDDDDDDNDDDGDDNDDQEEEEGGNDNNGDERVDGGSGEIDVMPTNNKQVRSEKVVPKQTKCPVSSAKISRHSKQRHNHSVTNMSESPLVNGIRLSPTFEQFWTKGYCWCLPAPRLRIHWTDNSKADDSCVGLQNRAEATKRPCPRCRVCRKRLHTLQLPRIGYAPHFSRQVTFDIIVEVYTKLAATAHTRLYKTSSPIKKRSSECSIFSALFQVFLDTYGMRSVVEIKLKLFFVSMCHYLHEFDAVAVFGELLGLHTPEHADEYDQAPNMLVALCVCCYSWLYSRGMVMNGDPFSGRLHGYERGNTYKVTTTEVAPATDGTTHWQFVRVEHALLCAQDNLLYPLVSPGFLRNIMLYMEEYAQHKPTRLLTLDSPKISNETAQFHRGSALWIELHRFLRVIVGEWKQQNAQFRVVERLLFVHPQRDAALEGDLLEKLRLMLSCFVFYDHERVGAMTIGDFETLLFKLRYIWAEGDVFEQIAPSKDKLFQKAISAIRKRFIDLNHDGQLCYLDFWAMLYIVGVKTRGLIHFHEIPSFCRDYRLEVLPELSDMVWTYMQLSCTLLLPKGLQIGKSSIDQKATRQHRRRVGGLHDGMFHFTKSQKGSLSTQELLSSDDSKKLGLFLDGSAPATRQTTSMTALDRFRPVSVETEFGVGSASSSRHHGYEPVVIGVRPVGPTPKPVAPLRVSIMGNSEFLSETKGIVQKQLSPQTNAWHLDKFSSSDGPTTTYTNMYIQFPQVPPVRRRVGATGDGAPGLENVFVEKESDEENSADYDDLPIQIELEEMPLAIEPSLDHALSSQSIAPTEDNSTKESVPEEPDPPLHKAILEKRRSATAVVVVPTIETEELVSRTSSRRELLKRPSSRNLQRAVSERIKLEEAAAQLEAEKTSSLPPRQPTAVVPIATTREKIPLDSKSDDDQSVISSGESEVDVEVIEAPSEYIEVTPKVLPNEPTPIPVEEVIPTLEPVDQILVEVVEPVNVQPVEIQKTETTETTELKPVVEEIFDDVVQPAIFPEPDVEFAIVETVELAATHEEAPTPALPDEPAPTITPIPFQDAESNTESEDIINTPTEVEYNRQVIKREEIKIHHSFRFSQQPTFLHSITVTNNPYRKAMWNPIDDSESDDEEFGKRSSKTKDVATGGEGFGLNDSIYSSDNDSMTSTRSSTLVNVTKIHTQSGEGETRPPATSPSTQIKTTKTERVLKPQPSNSQLSRLDNNLHPPLRQKTEKRLNYLHLDDLESIQDEGDEKQEVIISNSLIPITRKRLDDDAERALYGERLLNALGEDIVFSPEAEAVMQQKWQQFFSDSESKMFGAMRNDLEKKQREQREAEERQRRLRKKWQEQRDQDLLRLQKSRNNSSILVASTTTNSANGAVFRERRIHRESCRHITEKLEFGVSVERDLKEVNDMGLFHFYYIPEGHGSIITLKMHVLRGDAEVFMSTDTKVPCGTDFMWRSSERMAKAAGEGHRIILYPYDLLRVVTAGTANAASTEEAAAIFESNANTASLRSFYPKQPDITPLRVAFYLSAVALEPDTTFSLAIMSSGQKMQPSRSIETVDYLIDRFNMLSRSFQGQSTVPFSTLTSSVRSTSAKLGARSKINSHQRSFVGSENDTMSEEEGENENNATDGNALAETAMARRKSTKDTDVEVDSQEIKTFQHLLETLSEKKGFGSPRPSSILLAGPSEEHLEFVQDEGQRLQEMHRRLSPPKSCPEGSHGHCEPIAVVTERRLNLQGKRQKLRRVVAARLQQRLAPLRHKSIGGGGLDKSASTGALVTTIHGTIPVLRPVAYSITSLDPLPRSQRFKAATTSRAQTRRSIVAEKERSAEME
ncbi:unnamed protein product [Phytophthora fragariaefolia]|uniref:Unnamed protein product n=1 Tax=Phytophthora fragariaefolia TaxID=1490495 RepID=A0A9W7CN92_9STRA|nr:unnamed protein product [Phytophthora fragariaefolia]